jgi:ParB/RepB/Spo0J family partition protein
MEIARINAQRTAVPQTPEEAAEREFGRMGTQEDADAVLIPLDRLHPMPNQPRAVITQKSIAQMRRQYEAQGGQITPLVVRPLKNRVGHYEIIAGERRWRAAHPTTEWKGYKTLRAVVRELNDAEAFLMAAAENLGREDVTPADEVRLVARLRDEFQMTQAEIKKWLAKSAENLDEEVQGRGWVENRWNASTAEDFLKAHLTKKKSLSKVLAIAAAPNLRLQRDLSREFDALTVAEINQRIERWRLQHPAKTEPANLQADATPEQGATSDSSPATPISTRSQSVGLAPQNNAPQGKETQSTVDWKNEELPDENLARMVDISGRTKVMLERGIAMDSFRSDVVGNNLRRLEADLKALWSLHHQAIQAAQ